MMKKVYGLVFFSLLASANTSFSMDAEDFGFGGNQNRRGSWSSGESGALADVEVDERDELEKQSLLEVMKPGFAAGPAAGAIEWILACIHDGSINLINGKPTIAELRLTLNAMATSVEQEEYLDILCSEFISQNGEAFSVDGGSDADEEDDEGLAVYGLPLAQGDQEDVFADALDSDDEEPELSGQASQDDGEVDD